MESDEEEDRYVGVDQKQKHNKAGAVDPGNEAAKTKGKLKAYH